jgi:hypothetical protein
MNRTAFGRKLSWPNLKYNHGIFLEGLKKTINTSVRIEISNTFLISPICATYTAHLIIPYLLTLIASGEEYKL